MVRSPAGWPARIDQWREVAILALVLAGALGLPLVFHRDPLEMFRLPKVIFLRAEAILIICITLAAVVISAPIPRPKWRDTWFLLPLAALAAFGVLTLMSTNYELSMGALGSAAATAVIFFATVAAARSGGWLLIYVPLLAAVTNALLVIVEETNLWMPFGVQAGVPHHLQCDALIGNPNEVGGYLGAAALAVVAAIAARETEERWNVRDIVLVAVICIALLACQTLTAIIAFTAAAFFMLAIASWRKAIRVAAAAAVTAVLIVMLVAPFRTRATNVITWVRAGDYNAIFTNRFTPFVAAWSMFAEHPLTGVGPGAFAWQYYDYKIRAEQRYPSLRQVYNRGINFGEVHNDHLQALAEGGLIGYGVFLVLIGALGYLSFKIPASAPGWKQRFAHHLALPLAVFWIVLSVAQFPMETTVVRALVVHLAALCVGWRNS
ncbi:MAG TPA: O-antigen ligase family protein [Thermoanaerobaculia bacterium]|nr:O-antigen ligase family protein [Thermoanaerobaculia bacterium]